VSSPHRNPAAQFKKGLSFLHIATLLLIILSIGLASQWLAWQFRLPAIVDLITSGLLLGPVSGVIELGLPQTELTGLIGLGVAIILFEGGMDLKLSEFRRVGQGIGRLIFTHCSGDLRRDGQYRHPT